ncbi:MAG: VanZ family protein [Nocardioides sp.]
MFPVGGIGWMLLLAAAAALVCAAFGLMLARWLGGLTGAFTAALLWSLVVIALVTLLPTSPDPGIVPADAHATTCSFDYGGPAPGGFWIFAGGQRLLNTVLFVPSGVFLVLTLASRRRMSWVLVPLGLVLLAAYSVGIEYTQLQLARIDRACDVTDMVDNVSGALVGVVVGAVLALPLRFRRRP